MEKEYEDFLNYYELLENNEKFNKKNNEESNEESNEENNEKFNKKNNEEDIFVNFFQNEELNEIYDSKENSITLQEILYKNFIESIYDDDYIKDVDYLYNEEISELINNEQNFYDQYYVFLQENYFQSTKNNLEILIKELNESLNDLYKDIEKINDINIKKYQENNILSSQIAEKHQVDKTNYEEQFKLQFNQIYNINTNERRFLYFNQKSFEEFIDEINYIINNSDINIYYFYHYIYEKSILIPLVKDSLNNYYIQYTDPKSNKIFLKILLNLIKNESIKNEIQQIFNNFKNIANKLDNIHNTSKIYGEIKKLENLLNNKNNNNSSNNKIKQKYFNYINRQLKKLSSIKNSYHLPSVINNENYDNIQNIINKLSFSDIKLLQENDIILISFEKFKNICIIKKEYKKLFLHDYLIELINLNIKINNLLKKINLSTENFGSFIVDYNNYSIFYNYLTVPLLYKK